MITRILCALIGLVIMVAGCFLGGTVILNANPAYTWHAAILGVVLMLAAAAVSLLFVLAATKPKRAARIRRVIRYSDGTKEQRDFATMQQAARGSSLLVAEPALGALRADGHRVTAVHYYGV